MALTSTESIIIKGLKFRESSKIITLYSRDFGKFSAIIKGSRSHKSPFSSSVDTMNHVNLFFNKKENRDLQIINKVECIEHYTGIKQSLEKLEISYKVLSLINKVTYEYLKNIEIFNILKETMNLLNESSKNLDLIFLKFQYLIMKHSGIEPSIIKESNDIVGENKNKETFYSENSLYINRKENKLLYSLLDKSDLEIIKYEIKTVNELEKKLYRIISNTLNYPEYTFINKNISIT